MNNMDQTMDQTRRLSDTLSETSAKRFYNPFSDFDWPAQLEPGKLAFARNLSTLNFLPEAIELTQEQEQQFLLLECINFFSLNIQGEKALIEGMVTRLHDRYPEEVSRYLHHFIDEENKHMSVFAEFCRRYGGRVYGGKKPALGSSLGQAIDDLLFFARIVIFEEVADYYNRKMMDDTTLDSTVQAIHRMHHQDESRHLAFGRRWVGELYQAAAEQWSDEQKAAIDDYLRDYVEAAWREYYNPYFMRDAGIADAYGISRKAFAHPHAEHFRAQVMAPCLAQLQQQGILN